MSESGFSPELDRFIAAQIQSLEQLEILLLLSGNPHKWWTAKGVYEVIKSSLPSVEGRLREMTERAILRKEVDTETRYQFAPEDEAIWKQVSDLRETYKERPVKVVQAIYSAKAPDGVQEFARAFRVRKD